MSEQQEDITDFEHYKLAIIDLIKYLEKSETQFSTDIERRMFATYVGFAANKYVESRNGTGENGRHYSRLQPTGDDMSKKKKTVEAVDGVIHLKAFCTECDWESNFDHISLDKASTDARRHTGKSGHPTVVALDGLIGYGIVGEHD